MALLTRRNGEVRKISGPYLAPGSAVKVTAYEPGGVASAISSGAIITMAAGHEFAVGDKILINPGTDNTYSAGETVQSVDATSITMTGGAYSIAVGDIIFNVGADTSVTTTPLFDGSALVIYEDPAGSIPITSSVVTTTSQGEYEFYWSGGRVWELSRNATNDVILDYFMDGAADATTVVDALPTTATQGQIVVLNQGAGFSDIVYIYLKQSDDTYDWVELIIAP